MRTQSPCATLPRRAAEVHSRRNQLYSAALAGQTPTVTTKWRRGSHPKGGALGTPSGAIAQARGSHEATTTPEAHPSITWRLAASYAREKETTSPRAGGGAA